MPFRCGMVSTYLPGKITSSQGRPLPQFLSQASFSSWYPASNALVTGAQQLHAGAGGADVCWSRSIVNWSVVIDPKKIPMDSCLEMFGSVNFRCTFQSFIIRNHHFFISCLSSVYGIVHEIHDCSTDAPGGRWSGWAGTCGAAGVATVPWLKTPQRGQLKMR